MKRFIFILAFVIAVAFSSCSSSRYSGQENYNNGYYAQPSPITYQQFYDGLSPYGDWVNYPEYGFCWVPFEQGFRPYYTNGHWVYTNYGWTWVSSYNWGWAPFHYGRWLYDVSFGWMWVPGYEWGPAWVSWRGGGDYYGWAPLGPGMSINISIGAIPFNNWCFVPRRYINSPRINNYYVNQTKNVTIINNTTVINNTNITKNKTVYATGPAATEVEKYTNAKIRQMKLMDKNTPGTAEVSNRSVAIYRPAVKETPSQSENIKPARVFNVQELEANRQRNNINKKQQPPAPVQNEQKNMPNENRNPVREFPKKVPPVNNPPVNNPPANIPQKQQPVRKFNDGVNPSENNRVALPSDNNNQRINMPQRQIPNNGNAKNRQPIFRQRSVRIENVRPAQRIERVPQQERRINEKK